MCQNLFGEEFAKFQECELNKHHQVESGHIVDDVLADARARAGDPPVRKPTPPEHIELELDL